MDNQKIIFPSEEEKEQSISFIVENGMPKPRRFFAELWSMFHIIGFRRLFFGVGDSVFMAIVFTIFILGGSITFVCRYQNTAIIVLFLVSPLLYGMVQIMTTWKEWMVGVYEQKMVCRYTLRQVNTLRMMIFGGVSVFLCIGVSMWVFMTERNDVLFLRLLGIAFTSLLFFAVLELAVRWHCKTLVGNFMPFALWGLLGIFMLMARQFVAEFLMGLPVAVFWVLVAGGAAVYARMLYHWYFLKREGALFYAVN